MDERPDHTPVHPRSNLASAHPRGTVGVVQPPPTMDQFPVVVESHREGIDRDGRRPLRVCGRGVRNDRMPDGGGTDGPRPRGPVVRVLLQGRVGHRHGRGGVHPRRRTKGESTVQGVCGTERGAERGYGGGRRIRTEHGSGRGRPPEDSQHEDERVHPPVVRGVQARQVGDVRHPHPLDARPARHAAGPHGEERLPPRDAP
mmetsp:Transcript_43480/g.92427  ORF Transcript_43480/g.92427 Transcript_43480/m.92427 type:complete len:201 (+) Transcript_43480:532-1134(+)